MIELNIKSKSYGKDIVLRKVNLVIKKSGIYILKGKSGCGKSTLLNIVGLMDNDYEGEYFLDGIDVKKVRNIESLRQKYFTYLFQFPFFIESETLEMNIKLINPSLSRNDILIYLKKVKLESFINKSVSKLSGGEKRRLSLLSALIKRTPIVLCDELTGALDEENKIMVFDLLKELAKSKIIIFVTHEEGIVENYATSIISFENKSINYIQNEKEKQTSIRKYRTHLSFKYIFSHIVHLFKIKKIRTLISVFTMCIGLVSLGLTLSLTSLAKGIVTDMVSSQYSKNQAVISLQNEDDMDEEYATLNYKDTLEIQKRYYASTNGVGTLYYFNFDEVFSDRNLLRTKDGKIKFEELSISAVNEYLLPFEVEEEIYPIVEKMDEDDVILKLTKPKVKELCEYLNINYSVEKLCDSLKNDPLELSFEIENKEWEYKVELFFRCVGVVESSNRYSSFIHVNSLWNEYVYENKMQLLSSHDFYKEELYPWTMKKLFYVRVNKENTSTFIDTVVCDESINKYRPHLVKEKFAPLSKYLNLCSDRVFFTYEGRNSLHISDIERICAKENITSFSLCSMNGYYVIEEALVKGFSYPTMISSSIDIVDEYADANSYSEQNLGMYQGTLLYSSEELLYGDIVNASKKNSFKVEGYLEEPILKKGKYAMNNDEILISSSLCDHFSLDVGDYLYFSFLKDIVYDKGTYINEFENMGILICGVVENSSNTIFVPYSWFESFFIEKIFDEDDVFFSTKACLSFDKNITNDYLKTLNSTYKDYKFSSPLVDLFEELDKIVNYINILLTIFSFFTLGSSLLMMITIVFLFYEENKYEMSTYITLGYSRISIIVYFFSFGLCISLYSFLLSSINLLSVTYMLSHSLDFNINIFQLGISKIVILFIISLTFSILASLFALIKLFTTKDSEFLHEK